MLRAGIGRRLRKEPTAPVTRSHKRRKNEPTPTTARAITTTLAARTDGETERHAPTALIDSTDPVLPIDKIDPADPIDAIDPALPILAIDPALPTDAIDPAEPIDAIEPTDPREAIEPTEPSDAIEVLGRVRTREALFIAKS
jgi:hypothetical protein